MSRENDGDPLIMLLAGLRPALRKKEKARAPRAPARDCVPCTPDFMSGCREMRARGRHNGGASRSAGTQAADELLRNCMPIDTARLAVPLHHQTMEGCHQDARLSFHLHIRTKLARFDASA